MKQSGATATWRDDRIRKLKGEHIVLALRGLVPLVFDELQAKRRDLALER